MILVLLLGGLAFQYRKQRRSERVLRDLSGHLIKAQEEERIRIARELHDDFSQRLAAIGLSLSWLKGHSASDDDTALEQIRTQEQRLADLTEGIRNLSHDLHPSILNLCGLPQALQQYCSELSKAHSLQIDCRIEESAVPVPPDTALTIYRIVQEATRNVVRHANASRAEVHLTVVGRSYLLTIRDNGCGFEPGTRGKQQGLGVISMQERTRLLNGTIAVTSASGRGTLVTVKVPH
jgi:two-component system sensor histidine kinase UhpB